MRVLLWTESFWPIVGGSEIAAMTLIRGLRRRGRQFVVVTRQTTPDLPAVDDFEGVPVHRFPIDQAFVEDGDRAELLVHRQKVAALKRSFRPELIHVSLPGPSLILHGMTQARRFHAAGSHWAAPNLVTLHVPMSEHEFRPRAPAGIIVRQADHVTACSRSLLEQTRRLVPEIADRSSVIHNGLPLPAVEPTPLPLDRPLLLCLGRVVEQKGFDTAVRALPRIAQHIPGVRLVIAGDGPRLAELRTLAANLGITEAIDFRGWVAPDEVPTLMNQAAVVLMPSRWEPFGLVALQAAQMARPVVAARVDGLVEVVVHGQTGLLVDSDNPDAWAQTVTGLFAQPDALVAMGLAARRHARQTFSLDQYLSAYDRRYQMLATPGRRNPEQPA